MKRDQIVTKPIKSSFLSCEKDSETIIKKLFVSSQPYSNQLKRLLIVNTKDCLDDSNQSYTKIVENTTVKELIDEKYISLVPQIKIEEHEEVKNYIIMYFDDFTDTSNPEYRDCTVVFDIYCHIDYWYLGDYRVRPYKIMGIIDGILNNCKLSGIGTLQYLGMKPLVADNDYLGFSIFYTATHGNDDKLPSEV